MTENRNGDSSALIAKNTGKHFSGFEFTVDALTCSYSPRSFRFRTRLDSHIQDIALPSKDRLRRAIDEETDTEADIEPD